MDPSFVVAALTAFGLPTGAVAAADLPTGPPPRVAYGYAANPTFGGGDWELVRTDGSRQPLPSPPAQFVAYDDRVVNGYGTEGGVRGRGGRRHRRRSSSAATGCATTAWPPTPTTTRWPGSRAGPW